MTDDDDQARQLAFLRVWTVARGWDGAGDSRIVVVPPQRTLAEGFALARPLLALGPVRLVGLNVTMREHWPSWVDACDGPLALTEIDAYFPRHRAPHVAEIVPSVEEWLDALLGGVTPGVRPSRVFWVSAMERLFRPAVEDWLLAGGLARAHPRAIIDCPDRRWLALVDAFRGRRPAESASHPPLMLPFAAAGAFAAASARRVRDFVAQASVRARLRSLRASPGRDPDAWISLVGHWPRASRPVPESIGPLAQQRRAGLGVLLQGTLAPGRWTTPFERDAEQGPILPALDAPELSGVVVAVDQGCTVEDPRLLTRTWAESLAATARAVRRAFTTPLSFGSASFSYQVQLPLWHLAKLLTIDVLRAREAWHASRALLARHRFAGARVMMPHATSIADALTEQLLQVDGAETIELVHGMTEVTHQITGGRTATSVKALWSMPEVEVLAPFSTQRLIGACLPRTRPEAVTRIPPRAGEPVRILLASSYLVSGWSLDPRLNAHYQEPLLRQVDELRRLPHPVELRWRPHPGDDPAALARYAAMFPSLPRSTGSLDEDLRWAHVLATTVSSVTMEALYYDLPIFVHEVPRWDDSNLEVFEPARRFGLELSLSRAIVPCLTLLQRGDPELLAPERALRTRLLGPEGEPRDLGSLLWPHGEPRC